LTAGALRRILVVPQHSRHAGAARRIARVTPRKSAVKRCSVRGCAQGHYGKGFCKKHYTQLERHGRLTLERERGSDRHCSTPKCRGRGAHRRLGGGYHCAKCHAKNKAEGKSDAAPRQECSVRGCDSPHRAKGFCTKHYNAARWRRIKAAVDASLAPAPVSLVAENPVDIVPVAEVQGASQ